MAPFYRRPHRNLQMSCREKMPKSCIQRPFELGCPAMSSFFGVLSLLSSALMGLSMVWGYLGNPNHLLISLISAFLSISAHCLVFGIFTGAGKDTREIVQDLHLNPEFVGQTKSFRKITFPPALYAILLILITAILGGAISSVAWPYFSSFHGLIAWCTFAYNLKTFWLEFRCIRQNAEILNKVNRAAAEVTTSQPNLVPPNRFDSLENINGVGGLEWGSHVFALGKFLCFLGWNSYLPYLYLRFIVGYLDLAVWPFVGFSAILISFGYVLRWKYRKYRPGIPSLNQTPSPGSH